MHKELTKVSHAEHQVREDNSPVLIKWGEKGKEDMSVGIRRERGPKNERFQQCNMGTLRDEGTKGFKSDRCIGRKKLRILKSLSCS